MSSASEEDKIFVLVYYPGKWVLKANVLPTATAKDLRMLIPESNVSFIHNGRCLLNSIPFSMYNIKERDIIIVCKNERQIVKEKWYSITKDNETFKNRVGSVIDPKTAREAARLKDFQMLRLEKRTKVFMKLCAQYTNKFDTACDTQQELNRAKNSPKTIIPEKSSLNSDPLPIFWGHPKQEVRKEPLYDIHASSPIISQVKQDEITEIHDE